MMTSEILPSDGSLARDTFGMVFIYNIPDKTAFISASFVQKSGLKMDQSENFVS